MRVALVPVVRELVFGRKDTLSFPFGSYLQHEIIVVLIKLEGEVDATDKSLSVANVFTDV